jgi:hypothetical protein
VRLTFNVNVRPPRMSTVRTRVRTDAFLQDFNLVRTFGEVPVLSLRAVPRLAINQALMYI